MLTIWMWVAIVILALAILNWVPGVKLLVSPVIGMVTKLIEEVFKHSVGYLIWLAKLVFDSHVELLRHLTHNRKHFNPADEFED